MKIALITDTHFGARNDNINFNEYFYKFYEGIFFPYLQQNNIKHCIHLGDVLDRRKYVSYRIAKDFRERFIAPFNHLEVQLHMIVGNHDIYFKNTNDVNAPELLLQEYENVTDDIHLLIDALKDNTIWKFNLSGLRDKVNGIGDGNFLIIFARPESGKTAFWVNMVAGQGGFASQGAKVCALINEEPAI